MIFDLFRSREAPAARQRIEPRIGNTVVTGDGVLSSDRVRMADLFGYALTDSGANVNERTAMRVSAVYACVRLIAGAIAGLPLPIYRRSSERSRELAQHEYWWLLNEQPCLGWSAAQFWEFVLAQILLRGDCVCYLRRDRNGRIIAILPFRRENVHVVQLPPPAPNIEPRRQYLFHNQFGYFGAQQEDVLHFPGMGFDGRLQDGVIEGMSVIQWGARNGIGIAMRSDEYAGKFFSQGGQPQFAIKAPGQMSPEQQDQFREAWIAKYSGSGPNGIPLVLTEGLDVKELSMTAADAQLLESRQWQVVDICRAFGVPPFMIGEMGKATYNNTENLGVDFVKYTLGPPVTRLEQELNIKLWPRDLQLYTKFNTDGLMRGDATARANYYKAALGGTQQPAWMTPNEVREQEQLPQRNDGNTLARPKEKPASAPATESAPGDSP
jgi:HK97 family phage portal protein